MTPGQFFAETLLVLLKDLQIIDEKSIHTIIQKLELAGQTMKGAELVAHAWKDKQFKQRLLTNPTETAKEIDIITSNPNAPTILQIVENTITEHHFIVCTLCSCYPSALLGLSPAWYKSTNYRARAVREPRKVLEEFGVIIENEQSVIVHDSTADCRYLVLPQPPRHLTEEDIQSMSIEELKSLVTRDSMIGVQIL
jgi:nitrile hydratase